MTYSDSHIDIIDSTETEHYKLTAG